MDGGGVMLFVIFYREFKNRHLQKLALVWQKVKEKKVKIVVPSEEGHQENQHFWFWCWFQLWLFDSVRHK